MTSIDPKLQLLIETLGEFQHSVEVWADHNFGKVVSSQAIRGVAEEMGELEEVADITGLPRIVGALIHAHLKQEQKIRGGEENFAKATDAVGDILIYLADFCARYHIHMGMAVARSWEEVRERDWVRFPRNGVIE